MHVPFVLLALTIALACGCQPRDDGPKQPIVDLIALFPFTEGRPATDRILMGDPRDRSLLDGGWTAPETRADGRVVRRNEASLTRVSFDAGQHPTPLRIVLTASVEVPPRSNPRQHRMLSTIRVRLNNRSVANIPVGPELGPVAFDVPADRLRPGRNDLALKHVGTIDPRGQKPRRGATFFYESIAFEPVDAVPRTPTSDGTRLVLPAGGEAPFFVRVPAGAELRLVLDPPTAPPPRVVVSADGVAAEPLDLEHPAIDLPEDALARIVLRADAGPVTLTGASIWGRPAPRTSAAAAVPPPWTDANVVLYVVDTLRADALGCYGHPGGLSPAIDGLARDGLLFENTIAQSSWTRPSTASILTGEYPIRHGAITLENAIAPDVTSLAETFRAAGYRTGGFVTNVNVGDRYGFGRGFETYRYLPEDTQRVGIHTPAPVMHREVQSWLDRHGSERFFAYLHATDVHGPYVPSADAARRAGAVAGPEVTNRDTLRGIVPRNAARATPADVAHLRALYQAELADVDAAIALLLDDLARRGLLERTIVVLVADHGEEFHDHGGFGHGRTLFREQLHVPLIVRLPGRAHAGTRVAGVARQVDVGPTVLRLAGFDPPASIAGRPLLEADGRPVAAADVETVAETRLSGQGEAALVSRDWKAILRTVDGRIHLYDRRTDPGELDDRAGDHPVRVGYARQRLLELAAAAGTRLPDAVDAPPLDVETAERLEALGYLH